MKKKKNTSNLFIRAIVAQDAILAIIYLLTIGTVDIIRTEILAEETTIAIIDVHHHLNPVHHRVILIRVQRIAWKIVYLVNIRSGFRNCLIFGNQIWKIPTKYHNIYDTASNFWKSIVWYMAKPKAQTQICT